MLFGGMSYLAVLIAGVLGFVWGSVYYGVLGKTWMKAARIETANMTAPLLITSFICELVIAWGMAGVIGHLGEGQVTLWNGVVTGFFLWLCFMATTTIINQRYEGFGWDLHLIDVAHWLGVALIMGAFIGWWGV